MQYNKNIENIIKHVARLQGQLEAVKNELAKDEPNCEKASTILYAASRSFASVRALYVKCFLSKEFLKNSRDEDKLDHLLTLIKS